MPLAAAVVVSAAVSAYSANKAAKAQTQAAQEAGQVSQNQFEISRQDQLAQLAQQRADQKPWMEAGKTSLAQLMAANKSGGEFDQVYQRGEFEQDPGYAFRLEEGQRGIENQARASGGLYSGATLKALARFNSGLASQEFGAWDQRQNNAETMFEGRKANKFNRLSSLAGVGQVANNVVGAAGQQTVNNISNLGSQNVQRQVGALQDAGEARASGYVATGNAVGGAIKGLYGGYYG